MRGKTRIAIIGCGIITKKKHLPEILRLSDRIEVLAVCNRSREKARDVAELLGLPESAVWTDWETMISKVEDLDAVFIALPIPMNHPVSRACCLAGLSVLCEKPAGMTVDEAVDTASFSQTFDVTYMTAENYQYEPRFTAAARLIADGLIGKPHSISWNNLQFMSVDNEYNRTAWRNHNQYPGGYVMDGGVHYVHALQMLAGPVTEVFARTSSIDDRLGSMDMAMTLLTHGSGVVSSLNMGWRSAHDDTSLRVYGDEGTLIVTDDQIIERRPSGKQLIHHFTKETSFYLMWEDFIDALQLQRPSQLPKESPAQDVRVILGIIESGQKDHPVSL